VNFILKNVSKPYLTNVSDLCEKGIQKPDKIMFGFQILKPYEYVLYKIVWISNGK
jgi:hypothetical protein